jgi:putative peptide zinc metalloprotease protein
MPPDTSNNSKQLLRFRRDLKIYKGPLEVDGSPTFNIYDPVKGQFYKISWKESLIFRSYRETSTAEELAAKVSSEFPIEITSEDIHHFFSQAYLLGLLNTPHEGQKLYNTHIRSKGSWAGWLIRYYLFLKIPLFHPDRFLTRTLPYFKFLGSKLALLAYIIIIAAGFALLVNRSDQFFSTFSYFFNIEGIILYASMVTCVKCIHEFSHAYTAKNFGLYVPTMGIALLVLWPVLYTDVTEGWKLDSRKDRFLISVAGIAAESVMAGLATMGWVLTSPGLLHSLCFVLASTSWFSTIIINVNPAVRFDGYYILADLWGIDNLMPRAFAYTRWKFHQWLFGIATPCPEDNISTRRSAGFIFFSLYTITYRFFLYTAIALFVYYKFTKILGMFLFSAEVWIFFIMPVVWELSYLYRLRSKISLNFRTLLTIAAFSLISIWFFFPFPHQITFPGVVVPQNKQVIYALESGKITNITAKNGQEVSPGTPLIQIESEPLQLEISKLNRDQEVLKDELLLDTKDPEKENLISHKKGELAENEQKLLALLRRQDRLTLRSEIGGKVIDWDPNLNPGETVYEGEIFGSVADPQQIKLIAFVDETDIDYLKIGQKAKVVYQGSTLHFIHAKVDSIDRKRTGELIYPSLASTYGGPLAVVPKMRTQAAAFILMGSYYQVIFLLDDEPPHLMLGEAVSIETQGPWKSYFFEVLKNVYQSVFKESSF